MLIYDIYTVCRCKCQTFQENWILLSSYNRKKKGSQTNSVNYYMHTQVNIDICRCLFNAFTEKEKNSNLFVCRLLASLFFSYLVTLHLLQFFGWLAISDAPNHFCAFHRYLNWKKIAWNLKCKASTQVPQRLDY